MKRKVAGSVRFERTQTGCLHIDKRLMIATRGHIQARRRAHFCFFATILEAGSILIKEINENLGIAAKFS